MVKKKRKKVRVRRNVLPLLGLALPVLGKAKEVGKGVVRVAEKYTPLGFFADNKSNTSLGLGVCSICKKTQVRDEGFIIGGRRICEVCKELYYPPRW